MGDIFGDFTSFQWHGNSLRDYVLNDASYVLKPRKFPGFDNIFNEMIICLLQSYPDVMLNLVNAVHLKWILRITEAYLCYAALLSFLQLC